MVSLTCSAKYTLFPHLGHCGVVPPHCRAGLGVAPLSAAPYLVPVEVCLSGVVVTIVSKEDTDRPTVTAGNCVGLLEAPSVVVDECLAFEGLKGTVRGNPVTPRPLLVVVLVNTGLVGGESLENSVPSTVSSFSLASKISSDSGVGVMSRLCGNVEEIGLRALFGFSIGKGEVVREAFVVVAPVLCVWIGEGDRMAGDGEVINLPGGIGFDLAGDDGRPNGVELGDWGSCRCGKLAWRKSWVPKFFTWHDLLCSY